MIDSLMVLGHWPFRRIDDVNITDFVKVMDKSNVEKAMIIDVNGAFYRDSSESNYELIEALKGVEDRFIPLGTINPLYPGWKDDLKEMAERSGFRGLILYPNYHGYILSDERLEKLWEVVKSLNLFLSIIVSFEDSRQRHPLDVGPVSESEIIGFLRKHPELKLAVHNASYGMARDIFLSNPNNPNYLFDMTFFYDVPIGETIRFLKMVGEDRMCFSSFYPFRDYKIGIMKVKETGVKNDSPIFGNNIRRFLDEME